MNIADDIFKNADPAAVAVFEVDREISYAALNDQSLAFAGELRPLIESLLCPRVGLECPDGTHYIVCALGILRAGGCFVPIAPGLSAEERAQLVEEMRLDIIVRQTPGEDLEFEIIRHDGVPPPWIEKLAALKPAFIRFTSGTTGRSKGVTLSHKTLRDRIQAANHALGISTADRILWTLPMSHHFAVSIMLYLWHGAAIVLPCSNLPGDLLAASKKFQATVIYAAPFHYEMLSGCENADAVRWRLAVSTTAALAPATAKKFAEKFDTFPAQALGIIEVGLPCVNVPSPASAPSSVGRPQPPFEAKLRDSQLLLRGPGCLDAYLSPWKPRVEIFDVEGWFITGDLAEIDAEGRITLLGRTGTAISIGGMKFFPEEVETVLDSHPAISRSRVSARKHPDFGMVPVAEVELKKDIEAPSRVNLLQMCRRKLSAYKVPVEIRIVDSIPLTTSGKIKRLPFA